MIRSYLKLLKFKQKKKDNKACHIIRLYRRAKAAKEATQELEITQVNLSTNLSNNNRLKTRKLKKKSKNELNIFQE